jgi:hypothetical protein
MCHTLVRLKFLTSSRTSGRTLWFRGVLGIGALTLFLTSCANWEGYRRANWFQNQVCVQACEDSLNEPSLGLCGDDGRCACLTASGKTNVLIGFCKAWTIASSKRSARTPL